MPIEITLEPGKPKKGAAGKTTPEKFKKGPKLSKKKEKELQDLIDDMGKSLPITGKTKKKKKNPLGLKGGKGKPERTEKPGVPHGVDKKTQEGEQILNIAKGGSVKKFPDLSGDGKVTQKDILMGRGVIKAAKGGLAGRLAKRGYGKARK